MSDVATLPAERRHAERVDVSFPVTLSRSTGERVQAEAVNISASGILVQPATDLSVWSCWTAVLPGADPREVRIVRRDGAAYGCLFQQPFDAAELDAVIASDAAVAGFERLRIAAEAPPPPPRRGVLRLLKR